MSAPHATRTRYYLHQDEHETERDTFYCLRCNLFLRADHFPDCAAHSRTGDLALIERGKASLRGETAPAALYLAVDPRRVLREYQRRLSATFYRPTHARMLGDTP